MKTIILISVCLCLMVSVISAEKSHKHNGKLLKSGLEEHKHHETDDVKPLTKVESDVKSNNPGTDQVSAKPAGGQRKQRNNNHHHGKNKNKGVNSEAHTGRSRKSQTKPHKHNGQRSQNKHGRKHGRGKQAQVQPQ